MRIRNLALGAAVVSSLSACLGGPPPQVWLLETPVRTALNETNIGFDAIGLENITLPGYVEYSSIITREGDGRLDVDTGARWADEPRLAVTRVLAESLRRRSGADVLVTPLPRGFDPGGRVEVVFDRLLRTPSGGAELAGQIRLISGDGRQLSSVRQFEIGVAGAADADEASYTAFFIALSAALDELAGSIVAGFAAPA